MPTCYLLVLLKLNLAFICLQSGQLRPGKNYSVCAKVIGWRTVCPTVRLYLIAGIHFGDFLKISMAILSKALLKGTSTRGSVTVPSSLMIAVTNTVTASVLTSLYWSGK